MLFSMQLTSMYKTSVSLLIKACNSSISISRDPFYERYNQSCNIMLHHINIYKRVLKRPTEHDRGHSNLWPFAKMNLWPKQSEAMNKGYYRHWMADVKVSMWQTSQVALWALICQTLVYLTPPSLILVCTILLLWYMLAKSDLLEQHGWIPHGHGTSRHHTSRGTWNEYFLMQVSAGHNMQCLFWVFLIVNQ